jgi:hypothetical protein
MGVRGEAKRVKKFEKVLLIMIDGNPITVSDIQHKIGNDIEMYRLSNYVWNIKTKAKGIVKSFKTGKEVHSYQLMNPKDIIKYFEKKYANI